MTRPPTAAERRAAEVNARRTPRPPADASAEQARIEARTLEQWVDEGVAPDDDRTGVRARALEAAARARDARPTKARRTGVAPDDAADVRAAARDARRAAVLIERLGQAQEALDRDRLADARRLTVALARELPGVAAVHELLGVVAYRTGHWKQALTELETAQTLRPNVALAPVIADCYRALRRWSDVERVWADVRQASPAPDVVAEARIVAAGALADQGDLLGALRTMDRARAVPRRVRDHHLRQWYVLGDLHDRAGDPIEARRWFELVAHHDDAFVDVVERLRTLGP